MSHLIDATTPRSPEAMKTLRWLGIVLVIVSIVAYGHAFADYVTGPSFQYRQAAGIYVTNAKDAADFVTMREQLEQFNASIQDGGSLGLTASDCGRAWGWEQTRDYCMPFQRQYVAGLLGRINYYIDTFAKNNTSQYTDVYRQALENVRAEFDRNGATDWVASSAWMLKYNSWWYWHFSDWLFVGTFLGSLFLTIVFWEWPERRY